MTDESSSSVAIRTVGAPGDIGWMIMAHGEGYASEYGWGAEFERLVAGIASDFAAGSDDPRQAGWIAELNGERVGCVLLVQGELPSRAMLRLLFVDERARGQRIARRLVAKCIAFAQTTGYDEILLWTTSNLSTARRIYQEFGFELLRQNPGTMFGDAVLSQDWRLDLRARSGS
jgi:GNAT superfamily N-acetyltransferase